MGQTAIITCPDCLLRFPAEEYVDGECPDCGNEYEWDYDRNGDSLLFWESLDGDDGEEEYA